MNWCTTSTDGWHQNKIHYVPCKKNGRVLLSQQKQDLVLPVVQITPLDLIFLLLEKIFLSCNFARSFWYQASWKITTWRKLSNQHDMMVSLWKCVEGNKFIGWGFKVKQTKIPDMQKGKEVKWLFADRLKVFCLFQMKSKRRQGMCVKTNSYSIHCIKCWVSERNRKAQGKWAIEKYEGSEVS